MKELFGIPLGPLLVVLVGALALAVGALGVLAARNRVLLRLSVRNVGRRRARTALIVLGLMLGTAIVAAALTTGDTVSHSIRSTAENTLGETDVVVSAKGTTSDISATLGAIGRPTFFDESVADRVAAALAPGRLADGVTPAIAEQVALQAPVQRQTEPDITLFAADPARMGGFAPIERLSGGEAALGDLRPHELYLSDDAADELGVSTGDQVRLFSQARVVPMRVRDVVRFHGTGVDGPALLLPLAEAQRLLGLPGRIQQVLISNRGGVGRSDEVVQRLTPVLAPLHLEPVAAKQDALDAADQTGAAFMTMFSTFGTFSIAAGILLIFLIFVMLAAERRGELGIARAIGTRRSHLVELYTFEGMLYDAGAAVVGAILGALVAYGMVFALASAFGSEQLDIEYSVTPRSLAIACALGVLITLVVVAVSAWRVSRMTISAAIRNLPEPPAARRRRRWLLGAAGLLLGLLLAYSGYSGGQATLLLLGISVVIVSLVPLMRHAGVPDRAAFTVPGVALLVLWLLPWSVFETIFGRQLSMNFSSWIASGLLLVTAVVWIIMFNADVLLGLVMRAVGRVRRLAPILRIAMAYPLAGRFRTGTTLAMFTLVVFTLVTGVASTSSFNKAFDNLDAFGGGFQVRATTAPGAPIDHMWSQLQRAPGNLAAQLPVVGSESVLPADARQLGTRRGLEGYPVRGLDASFLTHTTFGLGSIARGYGSAREVWDAVRDHPGLAVVDSLVVPRRDQFGFAVATAKFKLTGFYFEEGPFTPVPVLVRDPQTGRAVRLTVIGVLKDTAPPELIGLSTSQRTLAQAFPGRVTPTTHYFGVAPGVDPAAVAKRLESAFLANGMEAESLQKVLDDMTSASLTIDRLIEGFMGLGLIVGVAALGVISARAVVERRQHIGVLRALGFRRGMVRAAFLLESSFVALTAIVVGTGLGLVLAWNIISDQRQHSSWSSLTLVVPWTNLAVIFVVVYVVALAATLAPALRASRIVPAEALRYQ